MIVVYFVHHYFCVSNNKYKLTLNLKSSTNVSNEFFYLNLDNFFLDFLTRTLKEWQSG